MRSGFDRQSWVPPTKILGKIGGQTSNLTPYQSKSFTFGSSTSSILRTDELNVNHPGSLDSTQTEEIKKSLGRTTTSLSQHNSFHAKSKTNEHVQHRVSPILTNACQREDDLRFSSPSIVKIKYNDGSFYEGECDANKQLHGDGSYHFPGGSVYEGTWKNGVREGTGMYYYPDGKVDVKNYCGGECKGRGVRWSADRQQAQLLECGRSKKMISRRDALQITAELGIEIPKRVFRRFSC